MLATKQKDAPAAGPRESVDVNAVSTLNQHTTPDPQAQPTRVIKERWNAPDGHPDCSPVWLVRGDGPRDLAAWEAANMHLEVVQLSIALQQRAAAAPPVTFWWDLEQQQPDPGPAWPAVDDPAWLAGEDDEDGIGLEDLEAESYQGPKPQTRVERALARMEYAANRVSKSEWLDLVLTGVL